MSNQQTLESPVADAAPQPSRRDAIKKLAAGGAIAWTAPLVIDSFASRAMAFTCTGPCYLVEINAECTLNDTSKGSWKTTNCHPACPPGASTDIRGFKNDTPADLGFTLINSQTRTWTSNGVTPGGTTVGWVADTTSNPCGVPESADGQTTHLGIDRRRTFRWSQATFNTWLSNEGVADCGNPKIENIAGSQILKSFTFPPDGVVAADWLAQDPDQWSCCGARVVNNVVSGGCETVTVTNTNTTPSTLVYTDGRSRASLTTVSASPWVQDATFTFDGRFQAKKSMSGFYRFTIGCACDA